MRRWLFIILAVVLSGWFAPTAHALTRAPAPDAQARYDDSPQIRIVVVDVGITLDTFQGRNQDPLSLHKYLYCQNNPVNHIDPSGHDLGDLILSVSISTYLAAQSLGPVLTAASFAASALTVAAIINDPQEFVGTFGPNEAANIVNTDLEFLAYYGPRLGKFISGYAELAAQIRPVAKDVLANAANQIKQLDENAVVGFRGSVARGYKGPQKGNDPFDPNNFDVDAFIISDKLAAQIPQSRGARFVTSQNSPTLDALQKSIDTQLRSQLSGLKSQPFAFRVFSFQEYLTKANDGTFVGGQ